MFAKKRNFSIEFKLNFINEAKKIVKNEVSKKYHITIAINLERLDRNMFFIGEY